MPPIAIYIHWPYCLSKCPYCDFNSHVASTIDHTAWLKAYLQEIEYFLPQIEGKTIRSIFFGGGTPSLMQPEVIASIIAKFKQINGGSITEITLEANPTSVEAKKFSMFKEAGINRVSIGVQSLRAGDLKKLGREHNVEEAKQAIQLAREYFPRYSFDLIYARENQTLADWQEELAQAMTMAGGHISLYQLTIEKGTPFYKLHQDGKLTIPSQDKAAELYEWTSSYLASYGYAPYEISNYALPGQESLHNLTYWNYQEYLGLGPGAHSRLHVDGKIVAQMNHHAPDKWLSSVANKQHGIQTREQLSPQDIITEILLMGLRLKTGINDHLLKQFVGHHFADVLDLKQVELYQNQDLLVYRDHHLCLTVKGSLLHNYLVSRIIK